MWIKQQAAESHQVTKLLGTNRALIVNRDQRLGTDEHDTIVYTSLNSDTSLNSELNFYSFTGSFRSSIGSKTAQIFPQTYNWLVHFELSYHLIVLTYSLYVTLLS